MNFFEIFKSTFFTEHLLATASLDSPKSVSLHCNELFFYGHMLSSACQWYFRNVYYLLVYLQTSNLGELYHYYEETGANN